MPDVLPEVSAEPTINFDPASAREYLKYLERFHSIDDKVLFDDNTVVKLATTMFKARNKPIENVDDPTVVISKPALDWVVSNPLRDENALTPAAQTNGANRKRHKAAKEAMQDLDVSRQITRALMQPHDGETVRLPLKLVKQIDVVLAELRSELCDCEPNKVDNICVLHGERFVQVKVG